jgi:DNA-directed RNA polymerase subunit RPC12/RpoP
MGIIFECSGCGNVLHRIERHDERIPNPEQVVRKYNNACPRCGKKLIIPKWNKTDCHKCLEVRVKTDRLR